MELEKREICGIYTFEEKREREREKRSDDGARTR